MSSQSSRLRQWLAHPLTQGKDIDSPETTALRRQIIRTKPFLEAIYEDWYAAIARELQPFSDAPILELGSGAGFLAEHIPNLLTSEIFYLNGMDVCLDAQHLPFRPQSLQAIVMTNVLHHIPDPALLFAEAQRCLVPGGKVVLIEPWLTRWSRFVYKNLHHEPVDEANTSWKIDGDGPLSSANSALPWILFHRDKALFAERFPALRLRSVQAIMPFRYLVSGGISMRNLMPAWSYALWRGFEGALTPLRNTLGMFAKIVLENQPEANTK